MAELLFFFKENSKGGRINPTEDLVVTVPSHIPLHYVKDMRCIVVYNVTYLKKSFNF